MSRSDITKDEARVALSTLLKASYLLFHEAGQAVSGISKPKGGSKPGGTAAMGVLVWPVMVLSGFYMVSVSWGTAVAVAVVGVTLLAAPVLTLCITALTPERKGSR